MKLPSPTPRSARRLSGASVTKALALRSIVQILLVSGRSFALETLREKLRAFFREEIDYDKRAVASLSSMQLIGLLLEASPALEAVGLRLSLTNGLVQLTTARVESRPLAEYLGSFAPPAHAELTQASLEVLACIACREPISQAEIDRLFGDTDKRHVVATLRQLALVEEFPGSDGRLLFATTAAFLQRFSLQSTEELKRAFSGG